MAYLKRFAEPEMRGEPPSGCTQAHVGIVIKGTYHYEMDDGTSFDVDPWEVYDIPGGLPHDEWVVGDARCVAIDVHAEENDPYKSPPGA